MTYFKLIETQSGLESLYRSEDQRNNNVIS